MEAIGDVWCRTCCDWVATAVHDVTRSVVGPVVGATLGLCCVASRRRKSPSAHLVAAGVGAAVGTLIEKALTPVAQQLVCGQCGCNQVARFPV
jgi:hypothetical protein